MRPILSLFTVIILSFICGALFAVPVYYFLHAITIDISFHKIVSHVTNICGLLFIFLYLKFYGLLNRETTGYQYLRTGYLREIAFGMGLGILLILAMEIILYWLGVNRLESDLDLTFKFLGYILLKGILSGLFVGLLEETMYRGALLGGLNKLIGALPAILISSIIYSAVHFIKFPALAADSQVTWMTGFMLLSHAFFWFSNSTIFDSFLALFAFGALLALVRLNKGNIYQCIGIHAGVVLTINFINKLTDYMPGNNFDYLVNKSDHLLGYLAFAWLMLVCIFYYYRQFEPQFKR